jgi:hypothetical protein
VAERMPLDELALLGLIAATLTLKDNQAAEPLCD